MIYIHLAHYLLLQIQLIESFQISIPGEIVDDLDQVVSGNPVRRGNLFDRRQFFLGQGNEDKCSQGIIGKLT